MTTLRILTRKSKLNFGKHSNLTVQRMLDLYRQKELIYYYFNNSGISFMDDILDELKIIKQYRIVKPSKDYSMYKKFNENSYYYSKKKRTNSKSDKLKKNRELLSKDVLRYNNRN